MEFVKAYAADLKEISQFFDDVCDYLIGHVNYPGWQKGVYPTGDDADAGIKDGSLYIAKDQNRIVGTVVLRHKPDAGYEKIPWTSDSNYEKIYVVHTLAVHPRFRGRGIAKWLLDSAEELARREKCIALRLDVAKGNIPAENLYKKCGYQYVGTTSLGREDMGLPWFNLYEKVL